MICLSSGISIAMTLDFSGVQELLFFYSGHDVGFVHRRGKRETFVLRASCIRVCVVKMKKSQYRVRRHQGMMKA